MQLLRTLQYFSMFMAERRLGDATVSSILNGKKWLALKDSMRSTRKVLRLLRTLEYSRRVIGNIKKIREGRCNTTPEMILMATDTIASAFIFLFFMFDHRVFLAEVAYIPNLDWRYIEGQLDIQLQQEL